MVSFKVTKLGHQTVSSIVQSLILVLTCFFHSLLEFPISEGHASTSIHPVSIFSASAIEQAQSRLKSAKDTLSAQQVQLAELDDSIQEELAMRPESVSTRNTPRIPLRLFRDTRTRGRWRWISSLR